MSMPQKTSTTSAPETIGGFTVHPIASLFPLLEGTAYDELKASIRDQGQQEPCIVRDGLLIDGRNRMRVCLDLGITPKIEAYASTLPVEQFILVRNLFRRHLTDDQRMMITAKVMLQQEAEAAKARQHEAGKQHGRGKQKKVGANSTQAIREPKVSEKIAAAAKGTDHQARQAVSVLKGAPELVEPVKNGAMKLKDAHTKVKAKTPAKAPPRKREALSIEELVRCFVVVLDSAFTQCPVEQQRNLALEFLGCFWWVIQEHVLTPNGLQILRSESAPDNQKLIMDLNVNRLAEVIRHGLTEEQRAELRGMEW